MQNMGPARNLAHDPAHPSVYRAAREQNNNARSVLKKDFNTLFERERRLLNQPHPAISHRDFSCKQMKNQFLLSFREDVLNGEAGEDILSRWQYFKLCLSQQTYLLLQEMLRAKADNDINLHDVLDAMSDAIADLEDDSHPYIDALLRDPIYPIRNSPDRISLPLMSEDPNKRS